MEITIRKIYNKFLDIGHRLWSNDFINSGEEVIVPGKYYLIEVKTIRKSPTTTNNDVIWVSWGYGSIKEMKVKQKAVSKDLYVDSTCLLILNEVYVEKRSFGHGVYHE